MKLFANLTFKLIRDINNRVYIKEWGNLKKISFNAKIDYLKNSIKFWTPANKKYNMFLLLHINKATNIPQFLLKNEIFSKYIQLWKPHIVHIAYNMFSNMH